MNKSHNPINSTYYFTDQDDTDATGDMNSASSGYDEYDEDYVDNIIPTKSTPVYAQQFNQRIANVKQISKKKITKQTTDLVVVNSSDRENKFSTKSNDYTIKIDYKVQNIENIIGVELVEGYIKNTAYNVNHTNNICIKNLKILIYDLILPVNDITYTKNIVIL